MSNYLAIATVTATLQKILQQAIQLDVDGARVTTTRPDSGGGAPETGVSLYLYHIKRNPALGNADMPARQRKGEILKRNQLALDLYYLLSFFGNDVELEPQRLLGSALGTLEDRAILSAQMIRETVNDSNFNFLSNSDLADQVEMIRSEFVPVSTDELSKVWSVFLQTPYALSVVYKLTVVLLEGESPSQQPLPVRERRVGGALLGKQPTIDFAFSQTGRYQPILANTTLLIQGKMLASATVLVRLCGVEVTPEAVKDSEITLPLTLVPAEALRAGVQGLQVIHPRQPTIGNITNNNQTNPLLAQRLESNVVAFVLRPSIIEVSASIMEGSDDEPRAAELTLVTDVIVGHTQRLAILLNELNFNTPTAYIFAAGKRNEDSTRQVFSVRGVKPGEYLVRIQVDGAESLMQVDSNPNSLSFEQYINPRVLIL